MKRCLIPILIVVLAVGVIWSVGCRGTASPSPGPASTEYEQRIAALEQQVMELTQQVDELSTEVSVLTAEVAPRRADSPDALRCPPPLGTKLTLGDIARGERKLDSYWVEQSERLFPPAPEDLEATRTFYYAWLDYADWIKENNPGFVLRFWLVGDDYFSRLDYMQLYIDRIRDDLSLLRTQVGK